MTAALTNAKHASVSWKRNLENVRGNTKERGESREMSGAIPINIAKPRRNSTCSNSLLFELDMSASQKSRPKLAPQDELGDHPMTNGGHAVIKLLEQSVWQRTELEGRVMQTFTLLKRSCEDSVSVDLEMVCNKMKQLGFFVKLVGQEKKHHKTLRSEFVHAVSSPFLMIFGTNEIDGQLPLKDPSPCILDPHFKTQFEIQHPSLSYSNIMEALPDTFVGSLKQLEDMTRILCQEMQRSFSEAGLPLPPWRVYNAIIPRWSLPYNANYQQEFVSDTTFVGSA